MLRHVIERQKGCVINGIPEARSHLYLPLYSPSTLNHVIRCHILMVTPQRKRSTCLPIEIEKKIQAKYTFKEAGGSSNSVTVTHKSQMPCWREHLSTSLMSIISLWWWWWVIKQHYEQNASNDKDADTTVVIHCIFNTYKFIIINVTNSFSLILNTMKSNLTLYPKRQPGIRCLFVYSQQMSQPCRELKPNRSIRESRDCSCLAASQPLL